MQNIRSNSEIQQMIEKLKQDLTTPDKHRKKFLNLYISNLEDFLARGEFEYGGHSYSMRWLEGGVYAFMLEEFADKVSS